jgi:hypothetical protein
MTGEGAPRKAGVVPRRHAALVTGMTIGRYLDHYYREPAGVLTGGTSRVEWPLHQAGGVQRGRYRA